MNIEQMYTGCLAHGAYYIESNGEAAIIDPLRDIKPYLEMAEKRGAKIRYVFETHFHADFVSGHADLARASGATIVYGPTEMKTGFDMKVGKDNEVFKLGNITITLLHTPGHTMESSCFLVKDESGKPTHIFTGDTLFIGDVGRPDLAQHVIADLTQEKLAGHLYDSLHSKILPLPDDLIVYPGHGAGSACGKNLSKETSDTLGNQKIHNYGLNQDLNKADFIKELLTGLMMPPSYFPKNVLMNINGYNQVDEVIKRGTQAIAIDEFVSMTSRNEVLILDTRSALDYSKASIPGSINIGIDGNFAVWVGTVVKDINQTILLVSEAGREEEAVIRLARVGYDNAIGYLNGGIDAWINKGMEIQPIESISVDEFLKRKLSNPDIKILDVRKKSEFDSEHMVEAENMPLDYFEKYVSEIKPADTYYVHCAGGYRSMIFASLMRKKGLTNLINIEGGFTKIKTNPAFALTEYVCPSTML